MKRYLAGCALAALATGSAYAQSTGSQQFEQQGQEIVVTGTSTKKGVDGIVTPDAPKTREVLTQQFITHQTPGQTINEIINQLPGVSFQNNDGYGGSGGFLTIRGFDQSRISETFDGIPLNDTGNYALYSNQQLDPELIDSVNVSLGSTDVDSPTPSATGSTVNYLSHTPTDDFHARIQGSAGSFNMFRVFGLIDTGVFTPFGTKAWISGSKQDYNSPFDYHAKINRRQFNAKVYQPVGNNGDFISVAGHYNYNKNNFSGSSPLRLDSTILNSTTGQVVGTRTPGPDGNVNRFPDNSDERNYVNQPLYTLGPCTRLAPVRGVAQTETTALSATSNNRNQNACGSEYDDRFNPSKTANIRVNSRFTLADHLILTVDPFFEYTDANGGGTVAGKETAYTKAATATTPAFTGYGYFGGTFYTGRDLNGDGDNLDTVLLLSPSNTVTNRYGVIGNLIYDFAPGQTFRVNYTFDYGHHRQTGEVTTLSPSGSPANLFPHDNDAYTDLNGTVLQKRNRLSLAILNQVSGQYRGRFFDEKLTIEAGVRGAFFTRKLDQRCFTTAGNGNVDCPDGDLSAAYAAANPYSLNATTGLPSGASLPGKRNYHFNKALPSAGLIYQITPLISVYGDYSKGLQVPGTDQLYNAYYYPRDNAAASPVPETADNFDVGVRARSGRIQAQVAGWYTIFHNRIESNYDPILQLSTYTNLGTVHRYGVDGSIAFQADKHLSLYGFGSYLKSKILDNVQIGTCTTGINTTIAPVVAPCTVGSAIFANTAGMRESGAPVFTYGGRVEGNYGPVVIGMQVKRTGPRYINDQNTGVYGSYGTGAATKFYQVYGNKTPSYTLVDLDARFSLEPLVHTDRTYFQLNVTNLFNKFFVGASSTSNQTPSNTAINFWQIGAPRTISGTLVVGF